MSKKLLPCLLFALLLNLASCPATDRVFYAGGEGNQQFFGLLELSDGSLLVGGASDDLSWLPSGTPTSSISANAANGSSIKTNGPSEGKVAFLLHLSADASTLHRCVHFPDGGVDQVQWIKTNTAPGQTTGDLWISGTWGKTSAGSKDGGFYIAKLNGNFLSSTPTGLEYVWNVPTHGKNDQHAKVQPWDVFTDGRVVTIRYGAYRDNWGELLFLPAVPGSMAANGTDAPTTVSPGMRFHSISNDGGVSKQNHYGTGETIPAGYTILASREILKTQRTNASGIQRSYTASDYHQWMKDENGYWRKGTYPLDVMWNNYWRFPDTGETVNNMWGGDIRGYIGYKLAGTGGTEGAPYTPRVGAITIDKRNDFLYVGMNWKSRLPSSNNPDFEPALLAYDGTGRMRWWARMYKEYNDDSATQPSTVESTVTSVGSNTVMTDTSMAGTAVNISRKTGGSDGYVNGYARLYWLAGAANEHTYSEITAYDQATGTFTLRHAPSNPVLENDPYFLDGTVMTKTHTSTPDQYVDSIAIDYSSPLNATEENGILYVAARSHGNNVSNFWHGNQIKAKPGGNGFKNSFTGSSGNIHLCWLGKYRDEGTRSTILASTYVAEFAEKSEFGGNYGSAYSDPLMDFWPSQNGGWPDLTSTSIGYQMSVNNNGQLVIIGKGRASHTTVNAFQRNIRPRLGGKVTAASSASEFTVASLAGADLFLVNCKIKLNNEIRVVTAFENETGTFTLATPLSAVPALNKNVLVDEGVGNWGNFIRVYSNDLSSMKYCTLLNSAINPVDGAGGGANSKLNGIWALDDKVIVTGYHENSEGNDMPTADVPSWGESTPNRTVADSDMAVLAILDIRLPIVDTNSNSIPDSWEETHFGTPSNTPDTVVKNGTPTPTYDVYVTGTDPHDTQEVFTQTHISPGSVRFTSVNDREYRLEYRTGLSASDPDWLPLTGWVLGTGTEMDMDPELPPNAPLWFIRAAVRVP